MLVINCKNYEEVSGSKIIELVKAAERVSERLGTRIAIAPAQHLVGSVTDSRIPILAQHVDDAGVGSTTGFVVPELLKKSGVAGSLINHSEHRISPESIGNIVGRMAELEMTSILCVRDVAEVEKYAKLNPDYVAIEPPELIGSGRAISKERPELIMQAADALKAAKGRTSLLCGAGIISAQDITRAMELGSTGILVASGIVKAGSWDAAIAEFARAMQYNS